MKNVICNTSPLQYLHQLQLLELLESLYGHIIIPNEVREELEAGNLLGVDVPNIQSYDWISIQQPRSCAALPLITDLGAGEKAVLALGLEQTDSLVLLDDGLARQFADNFGIQKTGTLGILLQAKKKKLLGDISPLLDQLERLRFRIHPATKKAVLKLADEESPSSPSSSIVANPAADAEKHRSCAMHAIREMPDPCFAKTISIHKERSERESNRRHDRLNHKKTNIKNQHHQHRHQTNRQSNQGNQSIHCFILPFIV